MWLLCGRVFNELQIPIAASVFRSVVFKQALLALEEVKVSVTVNGFSPY